MVEPVVDRFGRPVRQAAVEVGPDQAVAFFSGCCRVVCSTLDPERYFFLPPPMIFVSHTPDPGMRVVRRNLPSAPRLMRSGPMPTLTPMPAWVVVTRTGP